MMQAEAAHHVTTENSSTTAGKRRVDDYLWQVYDGSYLGKLDIWNSYYRDGGCQGDPQPTKSAGHYLVSLSRALSTRIPLEIISEIANALDPALNRETGTLLSMAVACTSWYPCCIRALYRNVVLRDQDSFSKLATLARDYADVRRRLEHTRSLTLGDPGANGRFPVSFPVVFAGMLPSLSKMELHTLQPPLHSSFLRILPKLGTVTDLTLSGVRVNNFHELRRIVSAFPSLLHLSVGRIAYARRQSPREQATQGHTACLVRLRTLSLDWSSSYDILACLIRWLIDAALCVCLSDFGVASMELPSQARFVIYDYLDLLLESVGPSIKRLVVAPEAQGPGLIWLTRSGSLRHCPNLQSLTFRLSEDIHKDIVDEPLSVLSSVCSEHIEKLVIVIARPITEKEAQRMLSELAEPSLCQLHECQQDPRFAHLRTVEWRITIGTNSEQCKRTSECGKRLFAPWHSRGILEITVWNRVVGS